MQLYFFLFQVNPVKIFRVMLKRKGSKFKYGTSWLFLFEIAFLLDDIYQHFKFQFNLLESFKVMHHTKSYCKIVRLLKTWSQVDLWSHLIKPLNEVPVKSFNCFLVMIDKKISKREISEILTM